MSGTGTKRYFVGVGGIAVGVRLLGRVAFHNHDVDNGGYCPVLFLFGAIEAEATHRHAGGVRNDFSPKLHVRTLVFGEHGSFLWHTR